MRRRSSTNDAVHQTTQAASNGVETLARFGYATKGVVYVIVGILAVMTTIGAGGSTEGSSGAIATIAQ